MKKFLTFQDLLRIYPKSESTLRREIAASLAGIGNFPRPVGYGYKRKLLFRPEDIEAWAAAGCQQLPLPNIEPGSSRAKRLAAAMQSLKQMGVKIND